VGGEQLFNFLPQLRIRTLVGQKRGAIPLLEAGLEQLAGLPMPLFHHGLCSSLSDVGEPLSEGA
jgi:hypothetical protein